MHLEQPALSKLQHGDLQVDKQSLSSTEDDMSMCVFT
jgi:hypothetical protein